MNILIVDDEQRARNLLRGMLTDIFNTKKEKVTIYDKSCLLDAVSFIKKNTPDVVLLDIEMPNHSGLDIVHFFDKDHIKFQIIFTTAYSDYAINAFKLNAIDYLLKPIDIKELENAIDKVKQNSIDSIQQKIDSLRKTFLELTDTKIVLEVPNGYMFVAPDDIVALEAKGMYVVFYFKDGTESLISKPMGAFTEKLQKNKFFYKPHRSYLVNLKYLKKLIKKQGNTIELENGMIVPLARNKKEELLCLISDFF